jgi:serine/threonine-protein kinase HipA
VAEFDALQVFLWGRRVGAVAWIEEDRNAEFQYDDDFLRTGFEISPIIMPLSKTVYRFPEHQALPTFLGLPGLLADSLTENFGNSLMRAWLARKGISFDDLTPVERLGYIGKRGMGALEFQPDLDTSANQPFFTSTSELVDVARQVLQQQEASLKKVEDEEQLHKLIQVSTSAGGAKAKAIIAYNEETRQVMSGQANCPTGFDHWIIKFADVENAEHFSDQNVGRLEYAYHRMAVESGITMMESKLHSDGARAHFMTRRFDRIENTKIHAHTFCGIAHQDRNPPGNTEYETLFLTARRLGLSQVSLTELYRRMVFNILARNQDDHSKNHAFLMDTDGSWALAPAYDITFSFKESSRWVDKQQMRCNGKRDGFTMIDLIEAAKAADVRRPDRIISDVKGGLEKWRKLADDAGLPKGQAEAVETAFRRI